ncbi:MAG: hypothetical protein HQL26_01630 [Candidatus Omnitrophica bacterium]|nr:hypothetical protein [Candidatus Omnitrophota bacterium]
MLKSLKNRGTVSMVEIVITAVIFLVAAGAIIGTTSMLRPKAVQSSKEVECMYAAKNILSSLRFNVDASTWDSSTNPLYPGKYSKTIDGCTISYLIINDATTGARNVYLNATWPD